MGDNGDGDHNTINISMCSSTTSSHRDPDDDLTFHNVDRDIREAMEVCPSELDKAEANAQTPVTNDVIDLSSEREETS